ncbi:hypothetical protein Hdeb2414_s0009g00300301 [Helianthus debilis subsp. tardiflorus]
MTTSKASIARIKGNGDSGSPCHRPICNLNSDVGDPLTRTDAQLDFKHAPIHFVQWLGNFIAFKLESRNFQFIESYAFSKSTLKKNTSFLLFSPKR